MDAIAKGENMIKQALYNFMIWRGLRKMKARIGGTISKRNGRYVLDIPEGVIGFDGICYSVFNMYATSHEIEWRMADTIDKTIDHVNALKTGLWGSTNKKRLKI